MGLRWEYVNHRVSLWEVVPDAGACPARVPGDVRLTVGCIGGPWSTGQVAADIPSVSYDYFAVESDAAAFAAVSVPVVIDAPAAVGMAAGSMVLAEHGLEGRGRYAALLAGLTLTTDVPQVDPLYPPGYDPSHGYTSRGIGAGVADLEVAGGVARFEVWVRCAHGPADRTDMNLAMQHARTLAWVHVLLVGLDRGAVTEAAHAYTLEYPPPPLLFAREYPRAPEVLRRMEIEGVPGLTVPFVGLASFDFRLFGSVAEGDYMREFSVSARLLSHDPATGRAVLDVDGYASNVGLLTYETMENDFAAGIVLLQIPSGTAEAGTVLQAFETGRTFLPLLMNPGSGEGLP